MLEFGEMPHVSIICGSDVSECDLEDDTENDVMLQVVFEIFFRELWWLGRYISPFFAPFDGCC